MRNKAIYLMTLLCVPAAAALIVHAPVAAAADNANSSHACAGNEIAANVVRTAATAGDNHAACN